MCSGVIVRSAGQDLVPGWVGVGRDNKFELLDMTEEPEAKKSLQYTTQTKFNGMLRRQGYKPRNADSPWRLKGAERPMWISSPFLMKFWKLVTV